MAWLAAKSPARTPIGRDGSGSARPKGSPISNPKSQGASPPPQVRIGGLRVADAEQRISPVGEETVSGLELMPGRAQLEVAFFGISFTTGDRLSYEYRLVGADDTWSAPQPVRSMLLGESCAGRLPVRSACRVSRRRAQHTTRACGLSGGAACLAPVVVHRVVVASFSRADSSAFERYRAAHRREISRAREERLVELERVRKRIAADLHDEIGSSLTQISILSEVARRQGEETQADLSQPLATIAASSRELVDSMSDIVWAINPAKDHLSDLTQRMRRLAADAFTASNTAFTLDLPPSEQEIALGANVRREVFLIFKEAVTNVVKHAACSRSRRHACDRGRRAAARDP